MHPDPLDLADCRRLRPDLGLEDHLTVFEAGPRPSGRDQAGHPPPVSAPAVSEPGVDTDLADAVVVVEWGEGIVERLSERHLDIRLERASETDVRTAIWRWSRS